MAEINSVVLVGRLTRDAELKYTQGGMAVVKFSLAINRRKKVGEQWTDEVNYFDAAMMGKSAESVHKFLTKGKMIGIQGELRQNRWEQDGQARSKVEVMVNNLQLLGGPQGTGAPGSTNNTSEPGISSYAAYSPPSDEQYADDIPF